MLPNGFSPTLIRRATRRPRDLCPGPRSSPVPPPYLLCRRCGGIWIESSVNGGWDRGSEPCPGSSPAGGEKLESNPAHWEKLSTLPFAVFSSIRRNHLYKVHMGTVAPVVSD